MPQMLFLFPTVSEHQKENQSVNPKINPFNSPLSKMKRVTQSQKKHWFVLTPCYWGYYTISGFPMFHSVFLGVVVSGSVIKALSFVRLQLDSW